MAMIMTTMTHINLHSFLMISALWLCIVRADPTTCYNSTLHASPEYNDVTLFQGAPTVSCEDDLGCSKTLISKSGKIVGVSRGCGLFGCIGKSCFQLQGHRMCLYCCRKPYCNNARAMTSNLTVVGVLSSVAGWLIRKH